MTHELRVHPEAHREFNDAIDYYERRFRSGVDFHKWVDAGFARIREHGGWAAS